jgi:hypothetical protein
MGPWKTLRAHVADAQIFFYDSGLAQLLRHHAFGVLYFSLWSRDIVSDCIIFAAFLHQQKDII